VCSHYRIVPQCVWWPTGTLRKNLQILNFLKNVGGYNCLTELLVLYGRGGQLVFDWDRLENFLITRDPPVGNKNTSRKCNKTEYLLKNVIFRYLVNPMQNQARSTNWHLAIDVLATPAVLDKMHLHKNNNSFSVYHFVLLILQSNWKVWPTANPPQGHLFGSPLFWWPGICVLRSTSGAVNSVPQNNSIYLLEAS